MSGTPNLTIITPCSRPHLLEQVAKSIDFSKIQQWIVCYDAKRVGYGPRFTGKPKILELWHTSPGVRGNPQRNFALTKVRDGFVYFLDDDTILPPEFWELADKFQPGFWYSFDQQRGDTILRGDKVEKHKIDTGMVCMERSLIGRNVWKADPDRYDDFVFIDGVTRSAKEKHIYIPSVGSIYNALRPL